MFFSPFDIGHSQVGELSCQPTVVFCISCFSVVGLKHHSQAKLIKKAFSWAYVRELESMIVDPRNGSRNSHPGPQAGSRGY